jgi:hypothetical protein
VNNYPQPIARGAISGPFLRNGPNCFVQYTPLEVVW